MTHLQQLFIQNLRIYRTKAGFSQLEFSEKIGISPNYLNAVENGKNFPSPEVLQKMIDSLNILPYQLFLEQPSDFTKDTSFNKDNQQKIINLKETITHLFDEMLNK